MDQLWSFGWLLIEGECFELWAGGLSTVISVAHHLNINC